jgi:malate dehydrogenase (oxaloacetate-decarboxylating)(NADP+)
MIFDFPWVLISVAVAQCLPVHIDVGTERAEYRNDPSYMGLRQPRVRGPEFHALIDEFFTACQKKYGRNVLIQVRTNLLL